jgi:hypothetical protein
MEFPGSGNSQIREALTRQIGERVGCVSGQTSQSIVPFPCLSALASDTGGGAKCVRKRENIGHLGPKTGNIGPLGTLWGSDRT